MKVRYIKQDIRFLTLNEQFDFAVCLQDTLNYVLSDADLAREMFNCVTTDEMLRILKEKGLLERVMKEAAERIGFYLNARVRGQFEIGSVVFSDLYGVLCTTGCAGRWLSEQAGEKRT